MDKNFTHGYRYLCNGEYYYEIVSMNFTFKEKTLYGFCGVGSNFWSGGQLGVFQFCPQIEKCYDSYSLRYLFFVTRLTELLIESRVSCKGTREMMNRKNPVVVGRTEEVVQMLVNKVKN